MGASYSSSGGAAGNAINNTVGAGLSLAVGQEEHASSVTRSGISAGEMVIRDGDAFSLAGLDRSVTDLQQDGLEDIFDARKVSERMEMGQVAGEVAFRAVGDITQALTREYTQAKMQAEAAQGLLNNPSVSDAERQVLQQALDSANATMAAHQGQYDLWKDGGTGKTLVHAAAGALVASLGGGDALGGALGAGAAELGRSLTANESRLVQELVSVGLGAVGGSSGAAAGLAGEKFNRQLHPEEMEFIKDKASEYAAEIGISVEEAEQHLLRGALMNNDDDWNELLTLYVPEHVGHYQDAFGWLAGKAGESNFQIRDNVGVIQPAFTSSAEERANETLHARQVLESPASLAMYLDSANITRGEATVGELLRAYLKNPGEEDEAFLAGMGNSLKGYAAFVDPATYRALASLTREMATDPKGTTAQVINGLQDLGIDAGADVMIDLLQMDLQDFRDGYAELQGGIALEVIAELATLGTVSAVTAAKYGLRGGKIAADAADAADAAAAAGNAARVADDVAGAAVRLDSTPMEGARAVRPVEEVAQAAPGQVAEVTGAAEGTIWLNRKVISDVWVNSKGELTWLNPLTGTKEVIPDGAKVHVDHILPRAAIRQIPGFDTLPRNVQKQILNDPANLQPMVDSANCSKGCRVEGGGDGWLTWNGEPVSAAYRDYLQKAQAGFRGKVRETIQVHRAAEGAK